MEEQGHACRVCTRGERGVRPHLALRCVRVPGHHEGHGQVPVPVRLLLHLGVQVQRRPLPQLQHRHRPLRQLPLAGRHLPLQGRGIDVRRQRGSAAKGLLCRPSGTPHPDTPRSRTQRKASTPHTSRTHVPPAPRGPSRVVPRGPAVHDRGVHAGEGVRDRIVPPPPVLRLQLQGLADVLARDHDELAVCGRGREGEAHRRDSHRRETARNPHPRVNIRPIHAQ